MDTDKLLDQPSYFVEEFIGEEPFPYQKDFMDHQSNRKAFCAGRRVGKSVAVAWLALWKAVTTSDAEVLITAKAQRQSMELFNEVKSMIRKSDIPEEEWGVFNSTRTEIKFENGSRIVCLPVGRDGSNIRGYGFDMIIVDEAAFIDDDIFQQVLSPMLAVGDGDFLLTSTPFGKRGFFYHKVEDDDDWHEVYAETKDNPLIKDKFIEEQRRNLTDTQFKQEILGQFDEQVDSFFTEEELSNCTQSDPVSRTDQDVAYLGVDLAAGGNDESVYLSVDGDGNVFSVEHTKNKRLPEAMERVKELDMFHDYNKILIDQTSLGTGIVQQLEDDLGRKVEGVKFTQDSKQSMYNALKKELQSGNLRFQFIPGKNTLAGNKLFDQCNALKRTFTTSGKTRIEHPSGGHDDFSDAFALAVWAKDQKDFARSDAESMKPFTLGSLR